ERRKHQPVTIPFLDVQINSLALVRRTAPGSITIRTAAGPIDAGAKTLEPTADFAQPFGLIRGDLTERIGTGIQQQVAISSSATQKDLQAPSERFYLAVRAVRPSPSRSVHDAHARFPGAAVLKRSQALLRGVKITF